MTRKTGRNDPCPCGSGKKYKKCCGTTEKLQAESDALAERRASREPNDDRSDSADYTEEEIAEIKRFDAILTSEDNEEKLVDATWRIRDILDIDPAYRHIRFTIDQALEFMHLCEVALDREVDPEDAAMEAAAKVADNPSLNDAAKEYSDQCQYDFFDTRDFDHKLTLFLASADLAMWIQRKKKPVLSLFWHSVAAVSNVGLLDQAREMREILDAHVKTVLASGKGASAHGLAGVPLEDAMARIIEDDKLFAAFTADAESAVDDIVLSVRNGGIPVRLSDDWVPAVLAEYCSIPPEPGGAGKMAYSARTFPANLPDIVVPQLYRDTSVALRQAEENLPEKHPLRGSFLAYSQISPDIAIGAHHQIADGCLIQLGRAIEGVISEYRHEEVFLRECAIEDESLDGAIDAALEAARPSRAAALAIAGVVLFYEEPDRRFHFARRAREVGRS